ncbi:MAG: TldD/PmbA family protein [Butyrivibrio sp.]|nr:TldD/PmbA family protein [Butyrivibrio sp.]
MKAVFSTYLTGLSTTCKQIIEALSQEYEYVSLLATDSQGLSIRISQHSKNVSNKNLTTERGIVVRVYRNGRYSEAAFDDLDVRNPEAAVARIRESLAMQDALLSAVGSQTYETGVLEDEPRTIFVEKEARILPEKADVQALVERLSALSDRGMREIEGALDVFLSVSGTHISKMFLTKHQDLRQSYAYVEATAMAYAPNAQGETKVWYDGISGCGGLELLDGPEGLDALMDKGPRIVKELCTAGKVVPGEYEIITTPDISGLIAHEAFGHGVEMDMFVKHRALGAEYIDQRVGSDLVTMHEGALCDESVTAYAFDDEGTPAGDVIEIDHGILRTGVCDALSALRLGIRPTGNGKREKYSHKVYTRMTNTVFEAGTDTKEAMIASVRKGYLLDGMESGMEDPKHWGIQCIVSRGYEIIDGELTGKVVSPVIMTGYVPDLLGGISMASTTCKLAGTGACGKGYKEWVKVADGGPYLKTKARLG